MIVVVNDANILIDLIKLNLVDHFFNLNWEFHSSDLIIENELYDEQKTEIEPYIRSGRLTIQKTTASDLQVIMEILEEKPQLSDKDCSALYCAQKLNASLVTSDNPLRKFAREKGVLVHGHLWVFDQMILCGVLSHADAIQKLNYLIEVINPKLGLPKHEVNSRLNNWSKLCY
jgi:rRNA-processing protein FCF1